MKKAVIQRIISLMLILAVILVPLSGTGAGAASLVDAYATDSTILLNGKAVYMQGFLINGRNYFRLRDLADSFSGTSSKFNVEWDADRAMVVITTGVNYTPDPSNVSRYYPPGLPYKATPANVSLLIDGLSVSIAACNIGNNNYVQLRDLGGYIPYEVDWIAETSTVLLYSKLPDHAYRLRGLEQYAPTSAVSHYFPRWSETVESYIFTNSDGTISLLKAGDSVSIETYNSRRELVSTKTIANELPIFGGFLKGADCYYIAYGQNNMDENNSKEVIRIVKYDWNFNRLGSVSVKNCNTTRPFDAAAGRMAESGDMLVFHTSREHYKSSDGLNHQSQLTLLVDTANMRLLNENDLGMFQDNHISHSFDQYVVFDGDSYVLLDHGDAYPRSVALSMASSGGSYYKRIDMFKIPGETGANCTGVSIGGFEASASSYIVAMNTIDHSQVTKYTSFEMVGLKTNQRDVILCVLPKYGQSYSDVRQITLQKYVGTDKMGSIPQLVKISDYSMMVLWQEFERAGEYETVNTDVKYVMIDENGNPVGNVGTWENTTLSECRPMVVGDKLIWYVDYGGSRVLYEVEYN